jgi:raffinose/stachyose/melibiose transport system permease protein
MHASRAAVLSTHLILIIASIAAVGPIVGIILISLDPPNAAVGGMSLSHLGLANIVQVWHEGDFAVTLTWSLVTSVATVVLTTAVSVPAGFAFATIRFPGRNPAFYSIVLGLLLPPAAILIPLYSDFRFLSLTGSVWAVVLPTSALSVAFGVFWMRSVFLSLPRELLEAGAIDGATTYRIFLHVALPLVRAAVLVLVLLTFLFSWNSFMLPLVMLAGSGVQTAPLSLATFQSGHVDDIPGLAASAVFVLIPVVIIYIFTQRHFIRGFTEGGLKA